jgi:phage-related protein
MTLATFTPAMQPSVGATNKPRVKILSAPFGDGYSQATADGLNHIRNEFSLTWEVLTPAQADAIDTFLRTQGGATPFYWTAPGASTPQKWTCEEWSVSFIQAGFRRITATFVQSFNLLT